MPQSKISNLKYELVSIKIVTFIFFLLNRLTAVNGTLNLNMKNKIENIRKKDPLMLLIEVHTDTVAAM